MNSPPDPLDPQRPSPTPFKISGEDAKIIQECNREAFYARCLPYAAGLSGATFFATRAGYLKPHASWGPTPKVVAAALLGYFVGKISYQQVCAEKLMANPNSQIGAALRARRQQGRGGLQDTLGLDVPGLTLSGTGSVMEDTSQAFDDSTQSTFTDMDTERPYQGFEDNYRPGLDTPQRPEDFILPPQAQTSNSYEEMRRKNRDEYEGKLRTFREEPQRQYPPARNPPMVSEPLDRYQPTNIYGDSFDK